MYEGHSSTQIQFGKFTYNYVVRIVKRACVETRLCMAQETQHRIGQRPIWRPWSRKDSSGAEHHRATFFTKNEIFPECIPSRVSCSGYAGSSTRFPRGICPFTCGRSRVMRTKADMMLRILDETVETVETKGDKRGQFSF